MMGGKRGQSGIRHRKPDPGGDGNDRRGIGDGSQSAHEAVRLPYGARYDGISIAERRAGALMERADEPQGARRIIIDLGLASGQPFSEIAKLRVNEAVYIAKRLKRG